MANKRNPRNLDRPVSFWLNKELFWEKNRVEDCVTIILRTKGCHWYEKAGCIMCGYNVESDKHITQQNVLNQLDFVRKELEKFNKFPKIVKVFTSGSFFDSSELSNETRSEFYVFVEEIGAEKLIVESRPEFVKNAKEVFGRDFILEVGVGLESANDFIRNKIINKGFTFESFSEASRFLKDNGFSVKVYLLLKPPFISESEAIHDAVASSKILIERGLADLISLNLMNIQSGTEVERLWRRGFYRPPWLWSAAKVLKEVKEMNGLIISDPVAAGKRRGPCNCGKCDNKFAEGIKRFSLSQNSRELNVRCECKEWWEDYLLAEEISRLPVTFRGRS
jgi:hypothetical protein